MIFFKSFSRYLIELFLAKSILKFLLLRRNRLAVITDMAHVILITPLERGQVYRGLAIHADHEVAGVPRLEGGGHNDVAAGRELKPPEHLPVVDVGPRGPGVVVVGEVRRVQSALGGRGSVQTESNL